MPFSADDIELELLDPGQYELVRLFQYPGMEWNPPETKYRKLRVDPPDGKKDQFAVLYTGNTLTAVAAECRVLQCDAQDKYTWSRDVARKYKVARYNYTKPALFLPIDGHNRKVLGLEGSKIAFAGYAPFQEAAMELYERFGRVVHGLSWESFHRNQLGRVFALWHEHKTTIGLEIVSTVPYGTLDEDPEWLDFLSAHPEVDEISS